MDGQTEREQTKQRDGYMGRQANQHSWRQVVSHTEQTDKLPKICTIRQTAK
jgi:hypothetical protein